MNIEQAKALTKGQTVRVPADRGDVGYIGYVDGPVTSVHTRRDIGKYGWVGVYRDARLTDSSGVWPSNRLDLL